MPITLRVLWPERVAFVAAAVVAAGILFLWLVLTVSVGSFKDASLDRAAFRWLVDAEAGLVLPLWPGLRALYLGITLARGYRSSRRNRTAVPAKAPENRDGA